MVREREKMKSKNVQPLLRRFMLKERLFSLPQEMTLEDAKAEMVTVAFVRHPLERLASAYYEKLFRKNFRLAGIHNSCFQAFKYFCSHFTPNFPKTLQFFR